MLATLRGDFFCLPFGGDSTVKGVSHTTHGEPATETWHFSSLEQVDGITRLVLTMNTTKVPGTITKTMALRAGQNVLYIRHLLEGYDVRVPLGHHATLAGTEEQDTLLVSTSPIALGRVAPRSSRDVHERRRVQRARRRRLVPQPRAGSHGVERDAARLLRELSPPPRFLRHHSALQQALREPAWTAAVNQSRGWLWFSLKDPAVLPSTVFWMENHGRHAAPWSSRNCCIGLEEVCAYFADGFAASTRKNELNEAGIATAMKLSPSRPTVVATIHGVTRIPKGFDRVTSARFDEEAVTFLSASGKTATASVNHRFLVAGEI